MKSAWLLPILLLTLLVPAPPARAQDPNPAEAELAKDAAQILMRFASSARSKKHGPMEKQAYGLIIGEYDPDHSRARKELDYKKVDDEWELVPPKRRRQWRDEANREGRFKVQQEWRETCEKLATKHRELGLALRGDDGELTAAGRRHLERAILYDPFDAVAHEALGHIPWENVGITYYGTAEQIAFMKKMKEIETVALTLAKKEYPVEAIDAVPDELNRLGLEIYGARTEHFTVFTRGTQDNANDVVQWGERALDFLDHLVGDGHEQTKKVARAQMKGWEFFGYLWTPLEMDDFKAANPHLLRDRQGEFKNILWRSASNRTCSVSVELTPASMHDHLIGHVFHYAIGGTQVNNAGLLEGVHHAATWFLKSTCITKFGSEPEGSVAESDLILPDGANWWLRELRNQAIARTDLPLDAVPRIQLWKFPPDARLKSWSFAVWSMARHPGKWLDFVRGLPSDPIPFPEKVAEVGGKVFGMPLEQVEEEWRDWASGRGVTAAATGYGPPLLPEFPNKDELDGLERLNEIRLATTCLPSFKPGSEDEKTFAKELDEDGWLTGLPECELDSEATAACKDHSVYLTKYKDHWKWPEAHEENPAREGFSPRGMRAGMRSVIVLTEGQIDAADSIDQWIGTVYHRFPLLEYNIKRFGLAHAAGPEGEVITLDMGSLEEPINEQWERQFAFAAWPPNGMKNVPRQFAYTEHPNPIEDCGLDFEDQKNTGYPVSLQFTKHVMSNLQNVTMKLYEAKKRGQKYENGDEVPCWLHTPDAPLLKRMVMRDVVFVIPKEVLKANETFKAVVDMTYGGGPKKVEWVFTTGTQLQKLGRLR